MQKPFKGTIAELAIQCIHPESGKTGCWLFTAGNHRTAGTSVSPVFDDLIDLFQWTRSNNWREIAGSYIYEGKQTTI